MPASGDKTGNGKGSQPPGIDVEALAKEFAKQLQSVGKDLKEAFDKVQDEAQYRFDKEFGKAMAKHPELYAELRKTLRQIKKTADKAAESFGLKPE